MQVSRDLTIPDEELHFSTSRSGGPGGQNVNKVSTRVTIAFDVASSPSLTPDQRRLALERLAGRIDSRGILRVTAQDQRTQLANRRAALERLAALLLDALTEAPERRPTRVPTAARFRRLDEKRRRSILKQRRTVRHVDDE